MIRIISVLLILTTLYSCSYKKVVTAMTNNICYASPVYHGMGGNSICLYADSTFKFKGYNAATFFSVGTWRWNDAEKRLELTSIPPPDVEKYSNRLDSLWMDLSKAIVKLKRNKQELILSNVTYSRRFAPFFR